MLFRNPVTFRRRRLLLMTLYRDVDEAYPACLLHRGGIGMGSLE